MRKRIEALLLGKLKHATPGLPCGGGISTASPAYPPASSDERRSHAAMNCNGNYSDGRYAPSGNPPRSGSAATLRTEKASGTYARRLSMVWTYRNDPRCHWLRSRRPQGIGTESVYAACLLYLFLATISRLTPPYLRPTECKARYGCLVFLRPESRLQIRTRLRRFCASSCRPAQSGGRSARRCIRCNPCCCTPRPPPCIRHGWQAAALEAGRAG